MEIERSAGFKRVGGRMLLMALMGICAQAVRAEMLVRDGGFEHSGSALPAECRAAGEGGKADLFMEDRTWNKCARLSIAKDLVNQKGSVWHNAFLVVGGSAESPGFKVEPGTFYDFSMEMKGTAACAYLRVIEHGTGTDGRVFKRRLPLDRKVVLEREWTRIDGRFQTDSRALRVELVIELWDSSETPGHHLAPGDYVLVDNIRVEKSVNNKLLFESGRKVAAALVSPVCNMACPFFPPELCEETRDIRLAAAVNERKPMPVAVANLSDHCASFQVVLETAPDKKNRCNAIPDTGSYGLAGFPPERLVVREAVRVKESDSITPTMRFDALPRANEAGIVTLPPREAGLVWFDFDTRGVAPGLYKGRLRVIPLGERAQYRFDEKTRAYSRKGQELLIPVSLEVHPFALSMEPPRPALFFSSAPNRQIYEMMYDLGIRDFFLNLWSFSRTSITNKDDWLRRNIADHERWAQACGTTNRYSVGYGAWTFSQRNGNPRGRPELKWSAWTNTVETIRDVMAAAGIPTTRYRVETVDEPWYRDVADIAEAHRIAGDIAPGMSFFLTIGTQDLVGTDFIERLDPSTSMWVFYDWHKYITGTLGEKIGRIRDAGKPIGHYGCSMSPAASLASYYRRHCWRGERYHWAYDCLWHFLPVAKTGEPADLAFKVPSTGGLVFRTADTYIPSIRYMAYREGLTDILYLHALRERCGAVPEVAKFLVDAPVEMVDSDPVSCEGPARMRERARALLLKYAGR